LGGAPVASDTVVLDREGAKPPRPVWNWNNVLTPRTVLKLLIIAMLVAWAYGLYLNPWPVSRQANPSLASDPQVERAVPRGYWLAKWWSDAAWGHGFLVPIMAALIVHYRLKEEPRVPRVATWSGGLVLILAGGLIRVWSRLMMIAYPGEVTFLLVVAGVVLWLLGKEMFHVLWIAVAFLWFMIPWDPKYYDSLALPLQRLSAIFVEGVLRLFNVSITRTGNVLDMGASGQVNVAEACSGLRLLVAFVALGVFMAYLYRRPFWERLVIVASSIPIAVFCNFLRVLLMAVSSDAIYYEQLALAGGHPGWSRWFPRFLGEWGFGYQMPEQLEQLRNTVLDPASALHQSFGFLMLGVAFVILYLELGLIDRLFISDEEEPQVPSPAAA